MNPNDLLPPSERERRRMFHALGLVPPVTMTVHPTDVIRGRIARTLPALLKEAVWKWRAQERRRTRVVDALGAQEAERMAAEVAEARDLEWGL
jgi:hypothetical protein